MVRVLASALLMVGCSSAPIIDFKVSDNPKDTISDKMECEWLVEKAFTFFPWQESDMYKNCLSGRGYAIVNYTP